MAWLRMHLLLFYKSLPKHSLHHNALLYFQRHDLNCIRKLLHDKPTIILRIKSSCDDKGCGIINNIETIFGKAVSSQHLIRLKDDPFTCTNNTCNNIMKICEGSLRFTNMKLKDIDALAVTVKPSFPVSLNVRTRFGKWLVKIGKKPFILIRHLDVHAFLSARIKGKICQMIAT